MFKLKLGAFKLQISEALVEILKYLFGIVAFSIAIALSLLGIIAGDSIVAYFDAELVYRFYDILRRSVTCIVLKLGLPALPELRLLIHVIGIVCCILMAIRVFPPPKGFTKTMWALIAVAGYLLPWALNYTYQALDPFINLVINYTYGWVFTQITQHMYRFLTLVLMLVVIATVSVIFIPAAFLMVYVLQLLDSFVHNSFNALYHRVLGFFTPLERRPAWWIFAALILAYVFSTIPATFSVIAAMIVVTFLVVLIFVMVSMLLTGVFLGWLPAALSSVGMFVVFIIDRLLRPYIRGYEEATRRWGAEPGLRYVVAVVVALLFIVLFMYVLYPFVYASIVAWAVANVAVPLYTIASGVPRRLRAKRQLINTMWTIALVYNALNIWGVYVLGILPIIRRPAP